MLLREYRRSRNTLNNDALIAKRGVDKAQNGLTFNSSALNLVLKVLLSANSRWSGERKNETWRRCKTTRLEGPADWTLIGKSRKISWSLVCKSRPTVPPVTLLSRAKKPLSTIVRVASRKRGNSVPKFEILHPFEIGCNRNNRRLAWTSGLAWPLERKLLSCGGMVPNCRSSGRLGLAIEKHYYHAVEWYLVEI